jgi:hypothetical protein
MSLLHDGIRVSARASVVHNKRLVGFVWQNARFRRCLIALFHQDPAHRFFAATAQVMDLTLVTSDDLLLGLGTFRTGGTAESRSAQDSEKSGGSRNGACRPIGRCPGTPWQMPALKPVRLSGEVAGTAIGPCRISPWRYLWTLRISTTSSVTEPRASAICRPSCDQAKLKIRPAVKSVSCLGGPPSKGCTQILETPCLARMYVSSRLSWVQRSKGYPGVLEPSSRRSEQVGHQRKESRRCCSPPVVRSRRRQSTSHSAKWPERTKRNR